MAGRTYMEITDDSGRIHHIEINRLRQAMASLERDGVDLRALPAGVAARRALNHILRERRELIS